jgi:hypothetical protein
MEAEPRRERPEDTRGDACSETSEEEEMEGLRTAVAEAIQEAQEQETTEEVVLQAI